MSRALVAWNAGNQDDVEGNARCTHYNNDDGDDDDDDDNNNNNNNNNNDKYVNLRHVRAD